MTCRTGINRSKKIVGGESVDDFCSDNIKSFFSAEEDGISCSCCRRVTGGINPLGDNELMNNGSIFVPCEPYEVRSGLVNKGYFRKVMEFIGIKKPLEKPKSDLRNTLTRMYNRI